MRDIQSENDGRGICIDKVGVKGIRYPIVVLDKFNQEQHTIADIDMYVNLPHHFRGTHMSRFLEVLNEYRGMIYIGNMSEILSKLKEKLNAEQAYMEVRFPYFIEKSAPVTGAKSLLEYKCAFIGSKDSNGDFILVVEIPINTLCPCSREISDRGAHNQRGIVKVSVRFKEFVWIEDIVRLAEDSASSEIFPLLKREDEKFLTEMAYDNPKFVEDIVRDIALKLDNDPNIIWFSVSSENYESIHNHSAYAFIERDKR